MLVPFEKRWKILIVDDTETNIDVLLDILPNEYDVSVALDGKTALQAIDEAKPDLILLDIMMPGMNGYQVCEAVKRNEETRQIPVIFLTALSEEVDEELGLRLGAIDYIVRPFNPELVRIRIRHQLELKKHQDYLEELVLERTLNLQCARDATIASMAMLAECRDSKTGGHIQRTIRFVHVLAEHLAPAYPDTLTPAVINLLSQSAPLHDIGKVGISDAILLKPGRLTDLEFTEMQKHTLLGAEAIRRTEVVLGTNSFLQIAREIAECHHEKWNGSGYPHGFIGEAIPLSARIMALADAYDALTSERPYKKPCSHEEAVRIIVHGDGRTQPEDFDPRVLNAFMQVHEEFRQIKHQSASSDPGLHLVK